MIAPGIWPIPRRTSTPRCRSNSKQQIYRTAEHGHEYVQPAGLRHGRSNPLMAPFFILFYGIMMADMGYGLVMMIAALVALGRWGNRNAAASISASCCCLRRVDVPARHRDGRLLRQRRADDREHVRPRRQARHPDKPAARPADRYDDDPHRRYGARLYPARDRHDREHGHGVPSGARSATRSSTRAHGLSCLRDLRCMCSRSATSPVSRSCCASAV